MPRKQDWSHFYLSDWPFQTVPDETFYRIWADRTAVKEQVDRLIWRWSRIRPSTFHLLWADLGSGKTHTLRHIQMRCLDQPNLGILPVYAVMPKYMRSFVDVYQAVIAGLDLDLFAEMFLDVYRRAGGRKAVVGEVFPFVPDAVSAMRALRSDSAIERNIALQWFMAARGLAKRQLDSISVTRQIRTSDDAVAVLSGLVKLVQLTESYHRVAIMLDECQRLGNFKLAIGRDISTGLQTWYDANANHLSLTLSFGSGEEGFVRRLLSPELQSREDHLRITMRLLSQEDALDFVRELLCHFRTDGSPSVYFPFTEGIVTTVIKRLAKQGTVTPRFLMKAFDAILAEMDFRMGQTKGVPTEMTAQHTIDVVETALRELEDEGAE